MRFFLYIILSFCLNAHALSYPRGCEVRGFNYINSYLVLNEDGKQRLYFLKNTSATPLKLRRYETRDVFLSPDLEVIINPGNWAAFASDIQNVHFQCSQDLLQIQCRDVLDICQYSRVKFALSNMGNYWVASDKSLKDTIETSASKGILLRW